MGMTDVGIRLLVQKAGMDNFRDMTREMNRFSTGLGSLSTGMKAFAKGGIAGLGIYSIVNAFKSGANEVSNMAKNIDQLSPSMQRYSREILEADRNLKNLSATGKAAWQWASLKMMNLPVVGPATIGKAIEGAKPGMAKMADIQQTKEGLTAARKAKWDAGIRMYEKRLSDLGADQYVNDLYQPTTTGTNRETIANQRRVAQSTGNYIPDKLTEGMRRGVRYFDDFNEGFASYLNNIQEGINKSLEMQKAADSILSPIEDQAKAISMVNQHLAKNVDQASAMIQINKIYGEGTTAAADAINRFKTASDAVAWDKKVTEITKMQKATEDMVSALEDQANAEGMVSLGWAINKETAAGMIEINRAYGEGTTEATEITRRFIDAQTRLANFEAGRAGDKQRTQAGESMQNILGSLRAERNMIGRFDVPSGYADKYQSYEESAAAKFGRDTEAFKSSMYYLDQQIKGLRMAEMANEIGDSFGSAFEDMVMGAKTAGEAMRGLASDIARMVIRQTITQPMSQFISSGLQGMFSGGGSTGGGVSSGSQSLSDMRYELVGVRHGGGIVGYSSTPMRMVSSELFANAPRFHSGLRSDEFPTILQKGEQVIPKGGSTTPSVEVIINNNGQPVSVSQDRAVYNPRTGKMQVYMTMGAFKGDPMLRQQFKEAMR